jgi:D-3-phosphoglycerate dehydrogenase
VGVDNVDVERGDQARSVVMNTPAGNTISTPEHAFRLLMVDLAQSSPQADAR